MANKIDTSSKNIKPWISLNHNIDITEYLHICKPKIPVFNIVFS